MKKQKPIEQIAKELAEKLGLELSKNLPNDIFSHNLNIHYFYENNNKLLTIFLSKRIDEEKAEIQLSEVVPSEKANEIASIIKEIEPQAYIYQRTVKVF